MAISYARTRLESCTDSGGNVCHLIIRVTATDDADGVSAELDAKVAITPVATLTQAIVDQAVADFRASTDDNGDSVDTRLNAAIAAKQANPPPTIAAEDYSSLPAS